MTLAKMLIVCLLAIVLLGTTLAFAGPRGVGSTFPRGCPTPTLLPTPAPSLRDYANQVAAQEFDLAQREQRRLRGECP
jgi:hypothetical protein